MKNLIIIGLIFFGGYKLQQSADASAIGVARSPAGVMFEYGGSSCPAHSLAEDGSSLLRAGVYANLFAAISTAYGAADGTHFNIPDLRGKFPRGVDSGSGNDPDASSRVACNTGGATGDNVGSCEADQFRTHTHGVDAFNSAGAGVWVQSATTNAGGGGTETSHASGGSETRPVNVSVKYCIWY